MLTNISNCAALYIRHFLAQSIRPGPRLVPPIQAQAAPQKSRQSTVKTLVFSRILKYLAKLVVSVGMKPTNERRQICKYPIKYLRVTGWRKSLFQPRKSVGKSREPESNAPIKRKNLMLLWRLVSKKRNHQRTFSTPSMQPSLLAHC